MHIKSFFDDNTSTFTYVVSDTKTKQCAIIDSVLGYDIHSGRTSTISLDQIINYIEQIGKYEKK
jgi:glyoxylase-like metal-dependent hydrolase (beta-lactamase superfamily II)